jgi:ssDNA-binding Zn-finger/Zn-ribbon topoisomerase 1
MYIRVMMVDGGAREGARKRCPRCGKTLRLEAFSRNRSKRDGRGCYCRECEAVRWKQEAAKRRRERLPSDLPGAPRFGNVGRPRTKRAKGKTLDELLGEW